MEGSVTLSVPDILLAIPATSKAMFSVSLINFLLFGVLSMQLLLYTCFPPDAKRSAKTLAYSVYLLELFQIYTEGAIILRWLRSGSGDAALLSAAYQSSFYTASITSLVAFLVQLYTCCQIWKLKNGKWYNLACGMIAGTSVQQLVGSIRLGVGEQIGKFLSTGAATVGKSGFYFSSIWLFKEAFVGLLTAVTLASLLIWPNAEHCRLVSSGITKLFIYINTLAAAGATATLVLLLFTHENLYFVLCTLVLGKLYANVLLAAFNHQLFAGKLIDNQSEPVYSDRKIWGANNQSALA
ncbi:hypothetical protein M378DRAFT_367828 [Amanita muscaria Koide BX008]|uniref:Uncharacterized protein n=1 Tax=Amanita muscaria (strain Koide BX008) TaxID=946122 RepID=A0A0C2ST68_AMAMK|nr:hypothetical protein M378DRAFT_367828 [Amanita muscaria Koide BX008]